MWGGRFEREPDPGFMQFSSSVAYDARMYPYDLECTGAWARALESAGAMTADELKEIEGALRQVRSELDGGKFEFAPADEDIHTAVERRLVELIGPAGGKVRTGRSRNDQVATDIRMLVKDACDSLTARLSGLQEALVDKAEQELETVVPGHTHLQQAQPVLLSHCLMAFARMLERDVFLLDSARELADVLPLGSGALAGTGIELDRDHLASELGFARASENSVDAVGDRDFVCSALFAASMVMVHLSRLAEQIVLWCSQEFGLTRLDDAWATGSSMMPQKKNPDGAELVRGRSGRVFGHLLGMLTTLKGLPLSYNRDLQEDKEGLFDALDTVDSCLMVMEGTVRGMRVDRARAEELSAGGCITATELADYLAAKGLDFPEAHRVVGEVVRYCLSEGRQPAGLRPEELARFSGLLGEDALDWLSVDSAVARRSSKGGTAPARVRESIAGMRRAIAGRRNPD